MTGQNQLATYLLKPYNIVFLQFRGNRNEALLDMCGINIVKTPAHKQGVISK
jgi:hypothetical protein